MEKQEVIIVLLEDFADWETAHLAPALRAGIAIGPEVTGGLGWQSTEAERIAPLVEQALALRLPVGAICNATLFLAAHGFLNKVRHTGNTAEMMEQWGGGRYTGRPLYEERQAVSDRGIVTANGTGYAEFAREMLRLLDADTEERIAAFYTFTKNGYYPA